MGRRVLYISRTPEQPPQKKISYRTHVVVERREGYNMYIGFQGLLEGLQHQGLVMLKRKMGAS